MYMFYAYIYFSYHFRNISENFHIYRYFRFYNRFVIAGGKDTLVSTANVFNFEVEHDLSNDFVSWTYSLDFPQITTIHESLSAWWS